MTSTVLVGGRNPDHIFKEKADQVEQKRQELARQEALDAKKRLEDLAQQGTPGNSGSPDGSKPETDPEKLGVSADFNIIETPDYFAMTGVRYGGKLLRLDLYKRPIQDLTPTGTTNLKMIPDGWASTMILAPETPIGPAPIYFSAFKALEKNTDHPNQHIHKTVLAARDCIAELLCRGIPLYTTSLVEYNPGPGNPTGGIIHPRGPHGTEENIRLPVLGASGAFWGLTGINDFCYALTGSTPEEIDTIWKWFCCSKSGRYDPLVKLNRLQNPPASTIVRSCVSLERSTRDWIGLVVQTAGSPDRKLYALGLRVVNYGYEVLRPGSAQTSVHGGTP